MVIFTDEQYLRMKDLAKDQRALLKKIRGNRLTDEQKFELSYLTRKMTDALANCQR